MVTLQIINMLSYEFEIHLVPFSKESKETITYKINDNVIIEDIDFPSEISQFDINFFKRIQNKKYFSALALVFKVIHTYIFKRFKIRKQLEKMTSKDDVWIFASQELLIFAPRNRKIVYHFHYSSKLYNQFIQKMFRFISTKPNYTIYLTESTEQILNRKKKKDSYVIYNPCRYDSILNLDYHNNEIISCSRLEDQKDPMLLLKIDKELEKRNFNFNWTIYGDGSFKKKMNEYINKNNLKNIKIISGERNLLDKYKNSDLYILTSKFEGFSLTTVEAASLSIPAIWIDMGDPTPTIILEGINGYVINKRDPKLFADKIIEILSNKEKLKSLKESTYKSSLRFNKEEIKNKWISTLNDIFNK